MPNPTRFFQLKYGVKNLRILKPGENYEEIPAFSGRRRISRADESRQAFKPAHRLDIQGLVHAADKGVVSRYAMRTEDGRELSNKLNVVFIDLTKVKRLEQNLDGVSLIEKWALFLKNADNFKKSAIIEEITSTEAGLMEAKKSVNQQRQKQLDCAVPPGNFRA